MQAEGAEVVHEGNYGASLRPAPLHPGERRGDGEHEDH